MLHTLSIAMQVFIAILTEIAKIEDLVNKNEDLTRIIAVVRKSTRKILDSGAKVELYSYNFKQTPKEI